VIYILERLSRPRSRLGIKGLQPIVQCQGVKANFDASILSYAYYAGSLKKSNSETRLKVCEGKINIDQ